jgi:transposase
VVDALLSDLWLDRAPDVAVNGLTIRADRVTVHATTTRDEVVCPSCGTASTRVHSRYARCLDDSAAAQRRVVIELQVRRFRCRERTCPRTTFAEQVAGLTVRRRLRDEHRQPSVILLCGAPGRIRTCAHGSGGRRA